MADVYVNAGLLAAQIAGDSIELDDVAERVAARGRENALRRGDTVFAESIVVENVPAAIRRSVRTRVVIATDPLAAAKELGHVIRNETDGPVLGHVAGLHYMLDAMRQMPEDSGA